LISRQSTAQLLFDAWGSLRVMGRRSLLALLGTVIGSSSVVALINIAHSASADAATIFIGMNTDTIAAQVTQACDPCGPIPLAAIDHLQAVVPGIVGAVPVATAGSSVDFNGVSAHAVLVGTLPGLAAPMRLELRAGRFLADFDSAQAFVVVGHAVAQELATPNKALRVGERIRIGNYLFLVIGIAAAQPPSLLLPVQADRSVFIPVQGMRRVVAVPQLDSVIFTVAPGVDVASVSTEVGRRLEALPIIDTVEVRIAESILEAMARQTRIFTYLLMALGTVSLLGGGVGVMNVTLMNVSQRRKEIGLRLALGARPQDIRNLFLAEAVALTAVGASAGAVLGVLAAYGYTAMAGGDFVLVPLSVPLGAGSTVLVGLACGLYPAISAARLQPVTALRDE
jgi:putative ABC transport system permease protein